ncbi:MAG: ABC transporter permease [Bryobacteraceae bacterium]
MLFFPDQLRHVVRRLIRAPLFTAVTLLTLAVGIGANTALFSVVNGVLLKPLPFPDPGRLVGVWHKAPGLGFQILNASPSTYFTYREEKRAFEDIALWNDASVTVTGLAQPEQTDALLFTDGMFPILRVHPLLGRTFTHQDDSPGSPETVILSYAYWQRKFGGDPNVLGRRLVLDGRAHDITGVMPPSFQFLDFHPAFFLPFRFNRSEVFVGNFSYQSVARLKPGVTIEQANADVARMIPMMAGKFPLAPGMSLKMWEEAKVGPNLHLFKENLVGDVGKILWVLMATVGIVLFIACANVANLFLVRAEGRQQEFAIRAALGAGWRRLARELLFESMTLGTLGGVLGLGLAYAGIRLLIAMAPANLPRLEDIAIDPPVLLFTLAIALLSGLLFGLLPVFKYAGGQFGTALREGGRNSSEGKERHRARSVLVIVQIALALVLLIGSGLMIRTFQALKNVQPGFVHPEEVLTLRISVPKAQIPESERVVRTHQRILEKIRELPGVVSAGLSNSITMDGSTSNDPVFVEDFPSPEGQLPAMRRYKWISRDYFKTMGNPLVAGRDVTWEDIYQKRPVLLVSENFAREYWKKPSAAIGRRVRETPKSPWREIIGVAGNERDNGVSQPAPSIIYWPMLVDAFWGQRDIVQRTMAYAIRSPRARTLGFSKEIRAAVWSVNPSLPLANVQSLQQIYDHSLARTSFTLTMLAIAAGMALLLGIVGIYGVISYSVSQRTREIGIRMALGARQEDVRRMFVQHGLLLTGIGIALGLATAVGLTRMMSALLFAVSPVDPLTYAAGSIGLVAAALLASYLPARRATSGTDIRVCVGL